MKDLTYIEKHRQDRVCPQTRLTELTLRLLLLCTINLCYQVFAAQNPTYCHTVEPEYTGGDAFEDTDCVDAPGPFYVRLYPHIIRRTNTSGGQSVDAVEEALKKMGEFFAPYNIFFVATCNESYSVDIHYIDDDDEQSGDNYFRHGVTKICDLYDEFNHTDGIDIFFDDSDIEDINNIGGFAAEIRGTAFVVGGTWSLTVNGPDIEVMASHIVSHEMGHCLGLFHTHRGVEGPHTGCAGTAYAAGIPDNPVNCTGTGDKCCDTPPDPDMLFAVNSACEWLDPLQTGKSPDPLNVMGHTSPYCMSYFSTCQAKIMRCELAESDILEAVCIAVETVMEIDENENTIWTSEDLPHDGNFMIEDELIVRNGYSLTIDDDVTIRFGENASLVIEPNAQLHLYGTLSSLDCNKTWQGVKVYGNGDESQFFDLQEGEYHQGLFKAYNGSLVENAVTAVELYGPNEEDTGGRIICTGTTFRNNKLSVYFAPYENLVASQPHPYIGSFNNCEFVIDNGSLFAMIDQLVSLNGVDGVRFAGCDFINERTPDDEIKQYEFGFGIAAIDAGFTVTAKFSPSGDICAPPCQSIDPSRFVGLGYGIYTGSYSANRLFRVYQAHFTDCYTGIEVDGVSAGVMIYDTFNLGTVPDASVMDGDQVGIKLNHQLVGFTIEENAFLASGGNVNNTIGIAAENIGEMNNVIRKNTFSGLTLANEAFGMNAKTGDELDGLRYTCNINSGTEDKDFFVKNTTDYGIDNVSALQVTFTSDGSQIATGNQFASSGDPNDGDFANYGIEILEYHYYSSSSLQVPDDFVGIANTEQAQQNVCSQNYCAPPCLSTNDLADLRDEYFEHRDNYEEFILEEEWSKAASSKALMDGATLLSIQHYLTDSTGFNRDSLRKWYSRVLTVSGDILLAKNYAAEGDYSSARYVLEDISNHFDLSTPMADDISDIDTIFGILDARGIDGLTQTDITNLVDFSNNRGHASSIARSILMLDGYRFGTEYVLPDPEPFAMPKPGKPTLFSDETVFPNPGSGQRINVFMPEIKECDVEFELWSVHGSFLQSILLDGQKQLNQIDLDIPSGVYIYKLYCNEEMIKSDRLIVQTN